MRLKKTVSIIGVILFLLISLWETAPATDRLVRSKGQTIYASAYSYVLMGRGDHKFRVTSTLVVRNTSLTNPIVLTLVDYRDSEGTHLQHHLTEPLTIGPLASAEFVVGDSNITGGHSPSFILVWRADSVVTAPVVETLMIGGASTQGISFIGRGWVIADTGDPDATEESR